MCHVNLIPLNPTAGYGGQPSQSPAIKQFIEILATYGIPATIRIRRGIDIDAGCGQLKSEVIKRQRAGRSAPIDPPI
jgi:23S rRNA (adenine2503-C2)-methyltransferase